MSVENSPPPFFFFVISYIFFVTEYFTISRFPLYSARSHVTPSLFLQYSLKTVCCLGCCIPPGFGSIFLSAHLSLVLSAPFCLVFFPWAFNLFLCGQFPVLSHMPPHRSRPPPFSTPLHSFLLFCGPDLETSPLLLLLSSALFSSPRSPLYFWPNSVFPPSLTTANNLWGLFLLRLPFPTVTLHSSPPLIQCLLINFCIRHVLGPSS